ncbi:MAG: hypothetical protein CL433_07220 [Acidimicrobiaceae bacterium]|jgi:hypothetical protein|nr:hypothetical protein [Acidimicrobiaceae bacterium]HAB58544.1 hypothetical protein [Acidimicrobiaceae bacterium]
MSERPSPDAEPAATEAEVSPFSLWFLRGVLVVAAAVVLAFAVQAIVSLLDDDMRADLPTTMTPTDLGIDEAAGPVEAGASETSTDEQAELDAFVDEAIAFIEETRRRDFLERPEVELVDVDTMTRIVLDDLESELAGDPEGSAASLAFARSVGFFGPDDEFLDVYEVFVSEGVLGVYFPSSDRLLVRSNGELTLSAKATVVHELVHAFDDQHFGLDRPELSADGDGAWAFTAAVEGSATVIEDLWRDSLSAADQAELAAEEAAFEVGDIFSLDFGFLLYQTAVYDYGNTWLNRRIAEEGIFAVDDAVANPPVSSEAVIEAPGTVDIAIIDVSFPHVDGEVLWQGSGGQALIEAITSLVGGTPDTASGWGGDALSVYRDSDGRECLRWDIVMDTPRDLDELDEGIAGWVAEAAADGKIIGDRLRIDRCA